VVLRKISKRQTLTIKTCFNPKKTIFHQPYKNNEIIIKKQIHPAKNLTYLCINLLKVIFAGTQNILA
jgi:hypothetical protein